MLPRRSCNRSCRRCAASGKSSSAAVAPPAVRVDVNPTSLNHLGLVLEDVRTVLGTANANRPKGHIADDERAWSITTTDQLLKADEYRPLIVAYRNGAPIRLADIATVTDGVEDIFAKGLSDGKPAVQIIVFRQPNANIIQTVDRVRALLPRLKAEIPAGIDLSVAMDRTTTIRASVEDVQFTLLISIGLVILVVFLFSARSAGDVHSQHCRARVARRHIRRDVLAGLQPRQSVADGSDGGDGFRGR